MRCGDTLFFDPARSRQNPHLWIVVTQPEPPGFDCVMVNATTLRTSCDQTVILRKTEHSFLKHDSGIRFSDAQVVDGRILDQEIASGRAKQCDPCKPAILELIRDGIVASPFTPNGIIAFYRAWKKAQTK